MSSLITAFILTALFYGPAGEVQNTATEGVYRTATACEARRAAIIAEPPVGLPPAVGLVCAEVQFPVNRL